MTVSLQHFCIDKARRTRFISEFWKNYWEERRAKFDDSLVRPSYRFIKVEWSISRSYFGVCEVGVKCVQAIGVATAEVKPLLEACGATAVFIMSCVESEGEVRRLVDLADSYR